MMQKKKTLVLTFSVQMRPGDFAKYLPAMFVYIYSFKRRLLVDVLEDSPAAYSDHERDGA